MAVSAALMLPFVFTSERKFVASTVWPRRAFVCATSAAFTVAFALVSPTKTLIGMVTSIAPLMLFSLTFNVWALVTFVSGIVTTLPLIETFPLHTPPLPTQPLPTVTCACGLPFTVTAFPNVTTIV